MDENFEVKLTEALNEIAEELGEEYIKEAEGE